MKYLLPIVVALFLSAPASAAGPVRGVVVAAPRVATSSVRVVVRAPRVVVRKSVRVAAAMQPVRRVARLLCGR